MKDNPRDPGTLRVAVDVNLGLNDFDKPPGRTWSRSRARRAACAGRHGVGQPHPRRAAAGQNRPADREEALGLLEPNLTNAPESVEDQSLKATILALRPAHRGEAVTILERLAGTNRLGDDQRFLLAQLYLGQGKESKYQDEMLKLLATQGQEPTASGPLRQPLDRPQTARPGRSLAGRVEEGRSQGPASAWSWRPGCSTCGSAIPSYWRCWRPAAVKSLTQIGAVADLLNRYGFAEEAETAYKTFAAREPKQPERDLALARFMGRQDRVTEAIVILKRAWTSCRHEQVAAVALSVYSAPSATDVQKRQVEAWVSEAVRTHPEADLLASKLAVLYIYQGQFDAAEGLFRRILSSNPDNAEALNGLAWLLALRDQSKAEEALGLISKAINSNGPSSTFVDTLAVLLIRTGKVDQAVEKLTEAQQKSPDKPSLALHLAWAFEAKGKKEEACQQFLRAEKLGLKVQSLDPLERKFIKKLRSELFPG